MELNEKCGIFGIYGNQKDVSRLVYYGLWALQHRGQENSGIASATNKKIYCHKGRGLVAHVYSENDLSKLKGNIAIGHNRYSTSGKESTDHSQPVFMNENTLALAHNGNLPQTTKLKYFLNKQGINTKNLNDSELMYKAIRYWLIKNHTLKEAIIKSAPLFTGAYSLLIMTKNQLAVLRDPFGIRPLCIGKLNGSYIFASETCALDTIGATYIRDVKPGELIIVDKNGLHSDIFSEGNLKLDIFELIYFARPDSILLGKSVYNVRKSLGVQLAKEVNVKADMIIPVPDSSVPSSIGFSKQSKIPIEYALVKNRYIHRTFIKPAQSQRATGVKMKLNLIKDMVNNKEVAVVDDSIVRGTTSKYLVQLFKHAGAKKVHMLIPAPPVKFPDFYGIDTPKQKELIASNKNVTQIKDYIQADSLHFLSYEGMLKAIGVSEDNLCTSCFTGNYPIEIGTSNKRTLVNV